MNKDVKICEYETRNSECKEVITYPYGDSEDSTEAWILGNEILPKTSKCPNAAAMKFYQYYMSKSDKNSKCLPFSMDFGPQCATPFQIRPKSSIMLNLEKNVDQPKFVENTLFVFSTNWKFCVTP